jgi:hypothetical protein
MAPKFGWAESGSPARQVLGGGVESRAHLKQVVEEVGLPQEAARQLPYLQHLPPLVAETSFVSAKCAITYVHPDFGAIEPSSAGAGAGLGR